MVVCNCCLKNKKIEEYKKTPYRYICDKCFKSKEYLKIKKEHIY